MADDVAVRDLVEHNRIAAVINSLFLATDAREWARVEDCFAPAVTFDMTSLAGGAPQRMSPEQIVSGWQAGLKPIDVVHHQSGNLTIARTGAEATASCYGIAYHYRRTSTGRNTRVFFSKPMRFAGWVCVVGIACVVLEMVAVLPYLPEEWWTPPDQLPLRPGQFDTCGMGVMHFGLLGWFGAWRYMAAIVWIPLAAWRGYRGRQRGAAFLPEERVLLALVPTLFLIAHSGSSG